MTLVSSAAQAVQLFLADGGDSPSDVDPTTGKGPEWGEAAPIGLLVIVLMCVAVYFLVKSMNRNLKKVPKSFGDEPALVGATAAAGTTAGTTSTSGSTAGAESASTAASTDVVDSGGTGMAGDAGPRIDPPTSSTSSATPKSTS